MRLVKPVSLAALFLIFAAPSFAANGIFVISEGSSLSWSADFANFNVVLKNKVQNSQGIAVDPAGWVYWADSGFGAIRRANFSGTMAENVITGLLGPSAVALDLSSAKIYWAALPSGSPPDGAREIYRANLDGSGSELLVASAGFSVDGMALDSTQSRLFWTAFDLPSAQGIVRSSNLDGSDVQTVIVAAQSAPFAIDLDRSNGRVYWTDTVNKNIHVADYDGDNHSIYQPIDALGRPTAISVDSANRYLYWVRSDTSPNHALMRGSLDSPTRQVLRTYPWGTEPDLIHAMVLNLADQTLYYSGYNYTHMPGTTTGWLGKTKLQSPYAWQLIAEPAFFTVSQLVLDPRGNGKLYWGNIHRQRIYQCNVDGSDIESVVPYVGEPSWLSIDLQNDRIFWSDTIRCEFSGNGGIFSANLEGANVVENINVQCMGSVAVDGLNGQVYWMNSNYNLIYRANYDGTNTIVTVSYPLNNSAHGIVADSAGGKIYWVTYDSDTGLGGMHRANSNGTQVEDLLILGPDEAAYSLSLDPQEGKIYWIHYDLDGYRIRRSNLDGTAIEDVTAPSATPIGQIIVDLRQPICTRTAMYADITGLEGSVEFGDIAAIVDAFRGQPSIDTTLCDLFPCDLGGSRCMGDGVIDFQDISQAVNAFRGVVSCPQ